MSESPQKFSPTPARRSPGSQNRPPAAGRCPASRSPAPAAFPRPRHPLHFAQPLFPVRKVPQTVADGHHVKSVVGKRDLLRVPAQKTHARAGKPLLEPLLRHPQHGRAEIQPAHFQPFPCHGEGHVSRPTAQIQSPLARLPLRLPDQPPFPMPVQPEALQVVDQVVTRSNGVEQVIHPRCAFVARGIVFVGHFGRRLSQGAPAWPCWHENRSDWHGLSLRRRAE